MTEPDDLIACVCGHAKGSHTGRKACGVCMACLGQSEHGAKPYCSRFKLSRVKGAVADHNWVLPAQPR